MGISMAMLVYQRVRGEMIHLLSTMDIPESTSPQKMSGLDPSELIKTNRNAIRTNLT